MPIMMSRIDASVRGSSLSLRIRRDKIATAAGQRTGNQPTGITAMIVLPNYIISSM